MRALLLLLALAGCGGAPVVPASDPPSDPHTQRSLSIAEPSDVPAQEPLSIPDADAPGPPIQRVVLLDRPHLRVAAIVLRNGTELPPHDAPVPVTIQAVRGAGELRTSDGQVLPLDATRFVSLAPRVSHSVTPSGPEPMVLLVHYLQGAARRAGAD